MASRFAKSQLRGIRSFERRERRRAGAGVGDRGGFSVGPVGVSGCFSGCQCQVQIDGHSAARTVRGSRSKLAEALCTITRRVSSFAVFFLRVANPESLLTAHVAPPPAHASTASSRPMAASGFRLQPTSLTNLTSLPGGITLRHILWCDVGVRGRGPMAAGLARFST